MHEPQPPEPGRIAKRPGWVARVDTDPAMSGDGDPTAAASACRRKYILVLLTLIYTFNFVDRQVLVILAEPIKAELGLKDWQLGFLTGTAFALFYALLGIPIARMADRFNRVNIIGAALGLWSAMTLLSGFATSFVQLAVARVGVAMGEAGGSPPSVSLLSSFFSRRRRATAMGIYSLGATGGILVGFFIGGLVNQHYGWRAAFFVAGVPGLAVAVLLTLTVRDPGHGVQVGSTPPAQSLVHTLRVLFSIQTYRWVSAAAVTAGIAIYAFLVWTPIYMIRHFGLSTGEVGTALGLTAGIAGSAGVLLGGVMSDWAAKHDQRRQLWVPACTTLMFFPIFLAALHAPTAQSAFLLLIPVYGIGFAYTGVIWAILQSITPPDMRATATAILLFLVNLFGLGLGPQLIGVLSDAFYAGPGAGNLREALTIAALGCVVSSLSFYRASRSLRHDTDNAVSIVA